MPEFVAEPVDVPWPVAPESVVYGVWDAHINRIPALKVAPVQSREVLTFDCDAFHRGMPALRHGWRFFIRASWGTLVKQENKLRRNANVYVPWSTAGW